MKFRVQVRSMRLVGDQVEVTAVSLEAKGQVVITVPTGEARDYRVGDEIHAEIRTRRENE